MTSVRYSAEWTTLSRTRPCRKRKYHPFSALRLIAYFAVHNLSRQVHLSTTSVLEMSRYACTVSTRCLYCRTRPTPALIAFCVETQSVTPDRHARAATHLALGQSAESVWCVAFVDALRPWSGSASVARGVCEMRVMYPVYSRMTWRAICDWIGLSYDNQDAYVTAIVRHVTYMYKILCSAERRWTIRLRKIVA